MKYFRLIIVFTFVFTTTFGSLGVSWAQNIFLPQPGSMVSTSVGFSPMNLWGIQLDPQNPFHFKFIANTGDEELSEQQIKDEGQRLISYFLAALTVPEEEMWVNLSPNEPDRIVPLFFGETMMGRDLLAQDNVLKQITASLIYPEGEVGSEFWGKIQAIALDKFGIAELPVETFNKVWIVPAEAGVYSEGVKAFVVRASFKVLLEEDYLNRENNSVPELKGKKAIERQILREIVIPELEKEVNFGKNFAPLRQVYHSLILAKWFKINIQNNILNKVYQDKNRVGGVEIESDINKEVIYDKYVESFKRGVFDYIKEEYDPVAQQVIPRKYFSGGLRIGEDTDKIFRQDFTVEQARQSFPEIGKNVELDSGIKALEGIKVNPVVTQNKNGAGDQLDQVNQILNQANFNEDRSSDADEAMLSGHIGGQIKVIRDAYRGGWDFDKSREFFKAINDVYVTNKFWNYPLKERVAFAKAVYPHIKGIIQNIVDKVVVGENLNDPIIREKVLQSMYLLTEKRSIQDAYDARHALRLMYDLYSGELRLWELEEMQREIDKELKSPGDGDIPKVVAVQDIHGGFQRLAGLVGFALNQGSDFYSKVGTADELIQRLDKLDPSYFHNLRIVGVSDKYDRGRDPEGVYKLAKWLTEKGVLKKIDGNHEHNRFWGVMGVDLLFPDEDLYSEENKGNHIGYWAKEGFSHAGWGDIELSLINEQRVNKALGDINAKILKKGLNLEPFSSFDVMAVRDMFEDSLIKIKSKNAEIRDKNLLNKNNPAYTPQKQYPLPDVFSESLVALSNFIADVNNQIAVINAMADLSGYDAISALDVDILDLQNFRQAPEVLEKTLFDLQHYRLVYIDKYGNLHTHNIIPYNKETGMLDVEYKGLQGINAIVRMQREVRQYFYDHPIPQTDEERQAMWSELGEAFSIVNAWYSDKTGLVKHLAVKEFLDGGGVESMGEQLLGRSLDVLSIAGRRFTGMMVVGHNELKKLEEMRIPSLTKRLASIDFSLSEGYEQRGAVLFLGHRDFGGTIEGVRLYGYANKKENIIEDITMERTWMQSNEEKQEIKKMSNGIMFLRDFKKRSDEELLILYGAFVRESTIRGDEKKIARYLKKQRGLTDEAMLADQEKLNEKTVGGIDLTANALDSVYYGDGATVDFAGEWMSAQLENIRGFRPVVFSVIPIVNSEDIFTGTLLKVQ